MKNKLFFIALVSITFLSCKKSDLITLQDNFDNNPSLSLSPNRILNQTQIDSIGLLHNLFLSQSINIIDTNAIDMQIEIDSVFRSITSYGLEISISEKVCLQGNTYNYEFFEEHLSPAALLIIDSAIDYINSPAYFDLSDLQSKITDWEITANMNLYGEELDAVLVYFSVLENSADFWMPTD